MGPPSSDAPPEGVRSGEIPFVGVIQIAFFAGFRLFADACRRRLPVDYRGKETFLGSALGSRFNMPGKWALLFTIILFPSELVH